MTNIPMPDPVAVVVAGVVRHLKQTKERDAFITTTQAEAYKDACVREALEALNNQAQELYESSLKSRLARDGAADEDELKAIDLWNVESVGMAKAYTNMQKAIRALIPPL